MPSKEGSRLEIGMGVAVKLVVGVKVNRTGA